MNRTRKKSLACQLLMAFCAVAIARAGAMVSIGVAPGYPGAVTPVSAKISDATDVAALQFDLAFNGNKAALQNVIGSAYLTNHLLLSRELSPGLWRVLIYSTTNASLAATNLNVANLPFMVAANEFVGTGPLTPTNILLVKADASLVTPVDGRPGNIFVRPVYRREDGVVDFFLPSVPDTRYFIQATTDFLIWETIATNIATGNFMALVDADAPNYPYRFYRWALDPAANPGSITALPNGTVAGRLPAVDGRSYSVEASTNLTDWRAISTQTASSGAVIFTDPEAPQHRWRFYRLRSNP